MKVVAYDVVQDVEFAARHGVQYLSLEDVLRESDFVSLHLFLDAKIHHRINAEPLALMKPTAYLISTSRGGVVDSLALYHALREKRIGGAAVDVFEKEPLQPGSPLRTLENLDISPHCSGASDDPRNAQTVMAVENVLRIFRREKPLPILNAEVLHSLRQG